MLLPASLLGELAALIPIIIGACIGAGELLFQEEVQPVVGWPPRVLAKGAEVPFLGGSPLSATFPEVPGHTRLLGRGMFAQAGFSCPGSLK